MEWNRFGIRFGRILMKFRWNLGQSLEEFLEKFEMEWNGFGTNLEGVW